MLERASGQGSILAVPCQQPLTDTPYCTVSTVQFGVPGHPARVPPTQPGNGAAYTVCAPHATATTKMALSIGDESTRIGPIFFPFVMAEANPFFAMLPGGYVAFLFTGYIHRRLLAACVP